MKNIKQWYWTLHGKHPVARDYITINKDQPMAQAFINWVDNGYQPLAQIKEMDFLPCSWRFWARTPEKGDLVCGVVKASCDSVGRSYPLLLMGKGSLPGWEENWDLLPYACENLWGQLEQLSTKQYDSFEGLKSDTKRLKPPTGQWLKLAPSKNSFSKSTDSTGIDEQMVKRKLSKIIDEKEIVMALKPKSPGNLYPLISQWLYYLKNLYQVTPNVVFLGGSIRQTYLAAFNRALAPSDLTLFWTLESLTRREDGLS